MTDNFPDSVADVYAEENATIENIGKESLALTVAVTDGTRVHIELCPGQVLQFTAGRSNARIVLLHGNPNNLLVIKPETAS